MLLVGGGKDAGPGSLDGGSAAVVDVGGGVQAEAAVAVLVVVPGKKSRQCALAASMEPNRAGNPGRYFRVLNCASE